MTRSGRAPMWPSLSTPALRGTPPHPLSCALESSSCVPSGDPSRALHNPLAQAWLGRTRGRSARGWLAGRVSPLLGRRGKPGSHGQRPGAQSTRGPLLGGQPCIARQGGARLSEGDGERAGWVWPGGRRALRRAVGFLLTGPAPAELRSQTVSPRAKLSPGTCTVVGRAGQLVWKGAHSPIRAPNSPSGDCAVRSPPSGTAGPPAPARDLGAGCGGGSWSTAAGAGGRAAPGPPQTPAKPPWCSTLPLQHWWPEAAEEVTPHR